MKIIFEAKAINQYGKEVTISISEPETGRTYGYSVKLPTERATSRGVYGTYIRSWEEITDEEIISNICKKANVKIIEEK